MTRAPVLCCAGVGEESIVVAKSPSSEASPGLVDVVWGDRVRGGEVRVELDSADWRSGSPDTL